MVRRAVLVAFLVGVVHASRSFAEDPVTKSPPAPHANRLASERSPYLLQHAHDPVDWRPWGPDALAEAKRRNVPVFLSIGYAACHWCHVMAHESFQDEATAALLNDAFVCVKVDREERPDVDDVYMAAVQVTSGRGGWPMTCLLTPDGRPFLARTYLPREALQRVVRQVRDLWRTDRQRLESVADEVATAVKATTAPLDLPPFQGTDADLVLFAVGQLKSEFDREHGGFDRVPKFPPHAALLFLLDRQGAAAGPEGLAMVRTTLDAMASGGVYDHVGGGFHRYSTDEVWLVPHFEKMLYDNALLARAYLEAYALDRTAARYAQVARETLEWVVREMAVAGGGYASSLDADTDGEEGLTYTWTLDELRQALGDDDAAFAARAYGVTEKGNYAEEASGHATGRNILHLVQPSAALAKSEKKSEADVSAALERIRARLLAVRAKRAQPGRDGKVITAWNALLLGAFARAGVVLEDPAWTARAVELARFLLRESRDGNRLLRFPKSSGPPILGFLDDHAHLADALLDLADATGDAAWAKEASAVADAILAGFSDPAGGFHSASSGHEALLARPKDSFDSPIPSGNATAARVLLRLSARTPDATKKDACDRAIAAYRPLIARAPTGMVAFVRVIADRAALAATGAVADRGDVNVRRDPATIDLFVERGESKPGSPVRFVLRVTLDAGWHVNAMSAPPPLIPTSLSLADKSPVTFESVVWPNVVRDTSAGEKEAVDVYRGTFEIRGAFAIRKDAPLGPRKVTLRFGFQPCDAGNCLRPEEVRLEVPLRFADENGAPRHEALFRVDRDTRCGMFPPSVRRGDRVQADVTLRIRMPHRAGTLSRIAAEIGKAGAVIGDLTTIHSDSAYSLRDVTIEPLQRTDVAALIRAIEKTVEGARVQRLPDRALEWHAGGKLRIVPTRPVTTVAEMRLAYTPGVARVCQQVAKDDGELRRLTCAGRNVLVLSDGSRVLGLGDLGARGAVPILEGKSIFYSQFVGLNGIPLALDQRDVGAVVELCRALRPNYSAIHLEDIAAPRCFELEERLQSTLSVPVLHDDRHGTAVVAAGAVLAALRLCGRSLERETVGQIGLGAAGYTILELLVQLGPRAAVAFDPSPDAVRRAEALGASMVDSAERVMREADIVVAASGVAGLIQPGWVRKGQIVFALTNPSPEIRPEAALEAGAAIASEGSAINNVLAYPGLMKGAIDAKAVRFTPAMKIAASRALAEHASTDDLLPSPFHKTLHEDVARAVAKASRAEAAVART